MSSNIPGKIPGTPPPESSKPIDPGKSGQQPTGEPFDTYMKKDETASKAEGPSPFELPGGGRQGGYEAPSMDSVLEQMNTTNDHLSTINDHLSQKNLKLKQSQKYLLNNKLQEAQSQVRSVAGKTGAEVQELPSDGVRQNPVMKFMGMVQDSQNQVNSAAQQIHSMKDSGGSMNPGDLLMVQVKLQKANTELEYSSVLLSSVSSDIKTIFNIQI
ncbi:MAG: hypothetical protein WDZ28_02520 [Simkaniaceae bacterium]